MCATRQAICISTTNLGRRTINLISIRLIYFLFVERILKHIIYYHKKNYIYKLVLEIDKCVIIKFSFMFPSNNQLI